jgi:hypothetical protein
MDTNSNENSNGLSRTTNIANATANNINTNRSHL